MNAAPRRPSIPPIDWLALAMCGGCIAGEQVSWTLWAGGSVWGWVLATAGLVLAGLVAAVRSRKAKWFQATRAVLVLTVAGVLAGSSVSLLQGAEWRRAAQTAKQCGAREWTGIVEADALPGTYGSVVRVRLTGGPLDGARVRITWPEECSAPALGRIVRFASVIQALPADEAWARTLTRSGVCATGTAWRAETGAWRSGIVGRLFSWRAARLTEMHDIGGAGGDLLEGIVLGDRRRLIGTSTEEDFRILGLTHLVAVSGSHLALACAAVAAIGGALRVPRRPLVVATVAAGAAYALITGMAYSALRSLLMLVIIGAGQLVGRRGSGMASLGVAIVCVLAGQPWAVYDIGLQLSALAVVGLLLFGALSSAWASYGVEGPRAWVTNTLALTCVAQVVTAPVIASAFGVVSVLAPVANACAGPMVSLALAIGLVGTVLGTVVPPLGLLAERAAATVLNGTEWVAAWMAGLPGAAVSVQSGPLIVVAVLGACAAVWVKWPLPRGRRSSHRLAVVVLVVSMVLAIGPSPGRRAEVVVLDVGQGDAILVRDSGRTMLVDTWSDGRLLREALARHGVRQVDVLVLTHAHEDHIGGADGLAGTTRVGWVGVPEIVRAHEGPDDDVWNSESVGDWPVVSGGEPRELSCGDLWWVGDIRVEVVWPTGAVAGLSTNDTSVMLHVSLDGFDAVLAGDAERAAQDGMLSAGYGCRAEVLKVPHHGSTNGLTAEGLAVWSPRDAIISVGKGNDFGHPAGETLEALSASGARVWRTDIVGDVTVSIGKDGYRVGGEARSERPIVRATIGSVRVEDRSGAVEPPLSPREACGHTSHRGPQARLPHLRRGGVAARPRAPPPSRASGSSSGPGLQLRRVRWGNGGRG